MLLEQLDLIDAKMREAADAILAHDSERLLANGRFLADRFATSSLRLDAHRVRASRTPSRPRRRRPSRQGAERGAASTGRR